MPIPADDPESNPLGRLHAAANERLRDARRSHSWLILFVAVLVLARLIVYFGLTLARANGVTDEIGYLRAALTVTGGIEIILDCVLLLALFFVFENMRRTDAEAARIQIFMDSMYRRGL